MRSGFTYLYSLEVVEQENQSKREDEEEAIVHLCFHQCVHCQLNHTKIKETMEENLSQLDDQINVAGDTNFS